MTPLSGPEPTSLTGLDATFAVLDGLLATITSTVPLDRLLSDLEREQLAQNVVFAQGYIEQAVMLAVGRAGR